MIPETPGQIIVLDDEECYAVLLYDLLCQAGYRVAMFTKPEDALETIRKGECELLISDFKMPGMDGSDVLSAARRINPRLPVLIISGLMNMRDLIRVANQGVSLVLEKPFDTKQFLDYVGRFATPKELSDPGSPVNPIHPEKSEPDDPAGSPAMKPKASQRILKSYPDELEFLSDKSRLSRKFIESLWVKKESNRCIFVESADDDLIERVAYQIASWMDSNEGTICKFTAKGLASIAISSLLKQIPASNEFRNVVIVEIPLHPGSRDERALLNFIQKEKLLNETENPVFVLFNMRPSSDLEMEAEKAETGGDWQELLKETKLVAPDLSKCPADIAFYTNRVVQKWRPSSSGKGYFDPVVPHLFEYSWPGGYSELNQILKEWLKPCEDRENPDEKDLIDLLRNRNRNRNQRAAKCHNLSDLLLLRQEQEIEFASKAVDSDRNSILAALGVDSDHIKSIEKTDHIPLIYPELIHSIPASPPRVESP